MALVAFVTVTIALDFFRAVRARRRTAPGWLSAAGGLLLNQNRRYGGFIVHLVRLPSGLRAARRAARRRQDAREARRPSRVEGEGLIVDL